MRRFLLLAAASGLAAAETMSPASAAAFTFGSPLSDPCHEEISIAAANRAGWPDFRFAPPLSSEEELIAEDLPFDVAGGTRDSWTMALVLGVRFNDLHGASALDLPALSHVHNLSTGQVEHCLRAPRHDGEAGDAAAVAACRDFMLEQLSLALGDREELDMEGTTNPEVALAFRGTIRIDINRYAFHLGRALHALQDSFTHMFRNPEDARVRHVLNFSEWATKDDYDEARDGFQHIDVLDRCHESVENERRMELATVASADLMAALADPEGGRAGRLSRAARVMNQHLALESGCTPDNDWCDAPERLEVSGCTVSAPGSPPQQTGLGWAMLLFAGILALCRRAVNRLAAPTFAIVLLLCSTPVAAQSPLENTEDQEPSDEALGGPIGMLVMASASIDNGAFAGRLGGTLRLSRKVELQLSIEWNPWYSIESVEVVSGAFNVFASFVYTWKAFDGFSIRTTAHAGASVLLFDLVGAPSGSTGPFVGANLLGLTVRVTDGVLLLLEPAEVVVPIPQVSGVPFFYTQYRFTAGIQWNP